MAAVPLAATMQPSSLRRRCCQKKSKLAAHSEPDRIETMVQDICERRIMSARRTMAGFKMSRVRGNWRLKITVRDLSIRENRR